MNTTKEEKQQQYIGRVKKFRLLDDDFMTACFQDYPEGVELIIQIIMNNRELKVVDTKIQHTVKNLQGRSLRLDVYATDGKGKKYNIEIQRDEYGSRAKRARLNSALIDSKEIPAGFDSDKLPETYIIFITEKDVFGAGLPIYHIDRYVTETGGVFPDEAHIIYVNAEIVDDTELGRLMHDFNCTEARDMYYEVLAKRVRYFKENEKGVGHMCKAIEEMIYEEKTEIVKSLLKLKKLSIEEIADASGLTEAEIIKIEEEIKETA